MPFDIFICCPPFLLTRPSHGDPSSASQPASGVKWVTSVTTCTTGRAGQSLTIFTFHLFHGRVHHFPPPLPKRLMLMLPKAQPLKVSSWGGGLPRCVPLSPLHPNLSLTHCGSVLETLFKQAGLPQILSCPWIAAQFCTL